MWLAILVYELVFWGLLIVILFYTSRVLIGYDDINLQNKLFQLVLYYTVASGSGILAWLNTELVIHPQNNKENQGGHQQDNEYIQVEHQQIIKMTTSGTIKTTSMAFN